VRLFKLQQSVKITIEVFKMAQELIKTYEKEIGEFEDWIKTQANLPKELGKTIEPFTSS
jgi:DNA polymerase I-like protein with 3'-5' exonuclease and polymerase domains